MVWRLQQAGRKSESDQIVREWGRNLLVKLVQICSVGRCSQVAGDYDILPICNRVINFQCERQGADLQHPDSMLYYYVFDVPSFLSRTQTAQRGANRML